MLCSILVVGCESDVEGNIWRVGYPHPLEHEALAAKKVRSLDRMRWDPVALKAAPHEKVVELSRRGARGDGLPHALLQETSTTYVLVESAVRLDAGRSLAVLVAFIRWSCRWNELTTYLHPAIHVQVLIGGWGGAWLCERVLTTGLEGTERSQDVREASVLLEDANGFKGAPHLEGLVLVWGRLKRTDCFEA